MIEGFGGSLQYTQQQRGLSISFNPVVLQCVMQATPLSHNDTVTDTDTVTCEWCRRMERGEGSLM